jgi:raffinose/stachyose/melibiose transport system substrate-binding protein
VEAPTTIEEFEAVCEALLAKGYQPIGLGGKEYPFTRYFINLVQRQKGTEFANALDVGTASWEDPACVNAVNMINDWENRGFFGRGVTTVDNMTSINMFAEKQCAILYSATNVMSILSQHEDLVDELGFFPFPTIEGGAGKASDFVTTYGIAWGLSAVKYDAQIQDWLTYVFAHYGDGAQSDVGMIPPYATTEAAQSNYWIDLARSAIDQSEAGFTYLGHTPLVALLEIIGNTQLVLLDEMSAEDFCAAAQKAVAEARQ